MTTYAAVTRLDAGVGAIETVADPIKPDAGKFAVPEPTFAVPFTTVRRSVAPAQLPSIELTAAPVTRPAESCT
jgi:hypothetical protein